jgi:hypothetical protein
MNKLICIKCRKPLKRKSITKLIDNGAWTPIEINDLIIYECDACHLVALPLDSRIRIEKAMEEARKCAMPVI